jgi:hypothetical protein
MILIKVIWIFEQVLECYQELDADRAVCMRKVSSSWSGPYTGLERDLKGLVERSKAWKKMIRWIDEEFMGVWPGFQSCVSGSSPPPPPLPSPSPLPALPSAPAPASVSVLDPAPGPSSSSAAAALPTALANSEFGSIKRKKNL